MWHNTGFLLYMYVCIYIYRYTYIHAHSCAIYVNLYILYYIYIYIYIHTHTSVSETHSLSAYLSICLSVHLSVCLSAGLRPCLFVCLFIYPCIDLFIVSAGLVPRLSARRLAVLTTRGGIGSCSKHSPFPTRAKHGNMPFGPLTLNPMPFRFRVLRSWTVEILGTLQGSKMDAGPHE